MNFHEIPRPWENAIETHRHHPMNHHHAESIPFHKSSHDHSAHAHPNKDSFTPHHWMKKSKVLIDQLGGLEGILETMNKLHASFQQLKEMAPVIQMAIGLFKHRGNDGLNGLLSLLESSDENDADHQTDDPPQKRKHHHSHRKSRKSNVGKAQMTKKRTNRRRVD